MEFLKEFWEHIYIEKINKMVFLKDFFDVFFKENLAADGKKECDKDIINHPLSSNKDVMMTDNKNKNIHSSHNCQLAQSVPTK